MPRHENSSVKSSASVPEYFFRIYNSDAAHQPDPTQHGFKSRTYGQPLSKDALDESYVDRHLANGFSASVESPWISGTASWLWCMFECERRLSYFSHPSSSTALPRNIRIAVISRAVLERHRILYLDVSGPQWHALARHAAEVLVHDIIPAKAVVSTFAYADIRQGMLSSLAPFFPARPISTPRSFPELYHANLPSASQAYKHSFRTVHGRFWSMLSGEDSLTKAWTLGVTSKSHWARMLTSVAGVPFYDCDELFQPTPCLFFRSEYNEIVNAFSEGFYSVPGCTLHEETQEETAPVPAGALAGALTSKSAVSVTSTLCGETSSSEEESGSGSDNCTLETDSESEDLEDDDDEIVPVPVLAPSVVVPSSPVERATAAKEPPTPTTAPTLTPPSLATTTTTTTTVSHQTKEARLELPSLSTSLQSVTSCPCSPTSPNSVARLPSSFGLFDIIRGFVSSWKWKI